MLKDLTPWIPFMSLVFVVLAYFRNLHKDKEEKENKDSDEYAGLVKSILKIDMKLDQVYNTTSETRSDLKMMNTEVVDLKERVTVLEHEIERLKNSN